MTQSARVAAKVELQAAARRLQRRQRVMVGLCILAAAAFITGMAWPAVHVSAVLLSLAAVGFIAVSLSVGWRNRAGDDVARWRMEAERD